MDKMQIDGAHLYALHSAGLSYTAIAKKFGVSRSTVTKLIEAAMRNEPKEFQTVTLGTAMRVQGDFIVAGDVHVPCTDWGFAGLIGRVADKTGIRRLILGGDFFNFDRWSAYKATVQAPTWHDERDAARILLRDWIEVFQEIYIITGNHDRRMENYMDGQVDEKDIWGMVMQNPKIQTSNYGYMIVESGGTEWRITHPSNYSRNQLVVASDLANKFQSNIMSFHEHHTALGYDVYGRYLIANVGTLVDSKKLAYVSLDDNRSAGMINSFAVLRDGVCNLIGRWPLCNVSEWLK